MKTRSILAVGAVVLGAILLVTLWPQGTHTDPARVQKSASGEVAGRGSESPVPTVEPGVSTSQVATSPKVSDEPEDFGAWVAQPIPEPDMARIEAFEAWVERWKTSEDKAALADEGKTLASARRAEFKALIAKDPKQALERSVSRVVRQDLPAAIVAELEQPVSATGNFNVYYGRAPEGVTPSKDALVLRYFETGGKDYYARVFGQMEEVSSRKGVPLRGVAIDREMAVAESPLRPLEVGERVPAGTVVQDVCPVSGETTEAVSSGEAVTEATPTVEVGESVITLCNGSHVSVLDEKYRTLVQASGSGSSFFLDAHPGSSGESIGNLRSLYIRAAYPEQMTAPNTEDQADADMRNNARYYQESSYGKMTSTYTITPLITLPHTLRWYRDKDTEVNGLGLIHSDARALARQLGYDTTQYHCILLRVNGGLRGGSSWGGGDSVWLGWGGMDVINHEVGHSLGLGHANYWSTTDGTAYGNGSNQEYGNPFDVMGGGGDFMAHYGAAVKRRLNWLQASNMHLPTGDGVFRIFAFDQPRLESGKRYGLNVAKNSSISYDLEFRPATPALAKQAVVIYGGRLIDTTPGTPAGKNDAGIQVGATYSDWESDQHFTLLGINATSPASIDVAYRKGPFPNNTAPAATLAATATSIAVGGQVTFTATASDAEGDPLAYAWQFSDGVTGTNSSSFTRSFDSTSQVFAQLTVSDLKGGSVRRSVLITVGSPSTRSIAGSITAAGLPLAGVLVSDGSRSTTTNSDGSYTLANVPNGSRTLTASAPGYTFTAGFTNPLTVSANVTGANWTTTGSTFVKLEKIADATEGGADGSFRLTRTGDASTDLAVTFATPAGTATRTTDYTLSPNITSNVLTIPAGSATLDVTVAAVNDTAAEGPETIALQVVSGAGYWSSSSNSVVMTVVDNDTTLPQVAVSAPSPYASESGETGAFVFSRTGSTSTGLNLTVAWSGSATIGSDYQTLPTTVTIPAGQSSATVTVTPVNDSLIEIPETVTASVTATAAYVRDVSATTATVTIHDDDTPQVMMEVVDSNASENGPDAGVILFRRSGATDAPLKVYYGVSGSALHGSDYVALKGEVVIPAGLSSAPVFITPYNDEAGEGPETVTLTLAAYDDAYSSGVPCQGTVTIADNADKPVISVRGGTVGVEGGANATVIFRSMGSASGNVMVNYTVSGTATSGSDFTLISGSVSVPATGPADVAVTIPVLNDSAVEPTETVVVTITPDAAYTVYNDGSATALIRDNDSATERVSVSTYGNITEGGSDGTFYFYRTGSTGDLTVHYSLSGSAVSGVDYTGPTGSVVIPDGLTGVNVAVVTVNDSLAEGSENLIATVLASAGYGVDFPASSEIEITDNDTAPVTVGFQLTTSQTNELPDANGQFRDFNVVLSAAASSAVSVRCVGASGSTASGDDVDWAFVDTANGNAIVPTATIQFPAGTTSQVLRVKIKNDGFSEPLESAVFELVSPVGVSLTSGKNRHTLYLMDTGSVPFATEERWTGGTIYNNQTWTSATPVYSGLLPGFTPPQNVSDSYSRRITGQIVAPSTGSYTFWVASDDDSRLFLGTNSSAASKVQIASLSGYSGFQSWDEKASQKSAAISLTAGQSYYLEVQQKDGGGGDHVSVAWEGPGFARKSISFEAPDVSPRSLRFATASQSLTENGASPSVLVILDRASDTTPVTVSYLVGGTATAGSDFTLPSGTLTFNAGEQIKQLPLSILADAVGESPEAIVITLSNPTGADLVTPSTHSVFISDEVVPVVADQVLTAVSSTASGSVIGTVSATIPAGRSLAGWAIVAGNTNDAFSINASGGLVLANPSALPNPGGLQLVVRATDSAGSSDDGVVTVVCNPSTTGVMEQRYTGTTAYNDQSWTGTPTYSGILTTFTTAQNVSNDYSRRLRGFIKPAVSGDYTFWVASDDDSRLMISADASVSGAVVIASVSGYTGFQSWDEKSSQKSAVVSLVAGRLYYLEAQQTDGGGGDHLAVAWQGPGIARQSIPASVIYPFVPNVEFGPVPVVPLIAVSSPTTGASLDVGVAVTVTAEVVAGSPVLDSVQFYDDSTLIGSDTAAPYAVDWTPSTAGSHALTARAVYAGGGVTSSVVAVTAVSTDPSADPDGDGFTTGLELALGTDPNSATSKPGAEYANLRAWWKLDETTGTSAADTTGRPQAGTVSGAAWSSGIQSGGLTFDGVDDGVVVGPSAAVTGTGNFTLSAWVKIASGTASGTVIQQREAGSTGYQGEYMLRVNASGTVNFFVYGTNSYQFNLNTSTQVKDNQWHLITAVRDGAAGRIFIDGTLAATATGTLQALQARAVAIGHDIRDAGDYFAGSIDDVRIYERALTGADAGALYQATQPGFVVPSGNYESWASGSGFEAGADEPGLDPDQDGQANLLEYVLSSNPIEASTALLPKMNLAGDEFVFTFDRRMESKADTLQVFQYTASLSDDWTDVPIGGFTSGPVTITPDTPAAGMERVEIRIPTAASPTLFGRLHVNR